VNQKQYKNAHAYVLLKSMPPKKKGKKEEGEGRKREEGEGEAGAVRGLEEGGGLEEVIRAEKEAKKRFQELLRNTR
jgi:hypothetical protein